MELLLLLLGLSVACCLSWINFDSRWNADVLQRNLHGRDQIVHRRVVQIREVRLIDEGFVTAVRQLTCKMILVLFGAAGEHVLQELLELVSARLNRCVSHRTADGRHGRKLLLLLFQVVHLHPQIIKNHFHLRLLVFQLVNPIVLRAALLLQLK